MESLNIYYPNSGKSSSVAARYIPLNVPIHHQAVPNLGSPVHSHSPTRNTVELSGHKPSPFENLRNLPKPFGLQPHKLGDDGEASVDNSPIAELEKKHGTSLLNKFMEMIHLKDGHATPEEPKEHTGQTIVLGDKSGENVPAAENLSTGQKLYLSKGNDSLTSIQTQYSDDRSFALERELRELRETTDIGNPLDDTLNVTEGHEVMNRPRNFTITQLTRLENEFPVTNIEEEKVPGLKVEIPALKVDKGKGKEKENSVPSSAIDDKTEMPAMTDSVGMLISKVA